MGKVVQGFLKTVCKRERGQSMCTWRQVLSSTCLKSLLTYITSYEIVSSILDRASPDGVVYVQLLEGLRDPGDP